MNYVKNYDVGNIRLDSPHSHFVYELPLLSFGDSKRTIGLSLVFQSKTTENPFYISQGYKFNLQKRLIFNANGTPESLEEGNGTLLSLNSFTDKFTFNDGSQRILRKIGDGTYVLENPDMSVERFDVNGRIKSVTDKYGEKYLIYTYYSGKLDTIAYLNDKILKFTYSAGIGMVEKVQYICANETVCTLNFVYPGSANVTITHYSGVSYYLTYLNGNFTAYSTDTGSAYSNDHSQKVICTKATDTITIEKCIGLETVDFTTYKYTDYSPLDGEFYSQIEVTDFYGVKSRTQFRGKYSLFTYEIGESDVEFNNDNHPGNVRIHRYSTMNGGDGMGEKQYANEGYPLQIEEAGNYKKWTNDPSPIPHNENGIWILTGWIKLINNDNNRDAIEFFVTRNANNQQIINKYRLPKPPIGQWSYFAIPLIEVENEITIGDFNDDIETKDFRLINRNLYPLPGSNIYHLSPSTNLLIYHANSTSVYIPIDEANFKYGDVDLSSYGTVYYEDLLKYKINKWKNINTSEFYLNMLKNIITVNASAEITVIYGNNTYALADCYLGEYNYTRRGDIITQIIDDSSSSLTIRSTDTNGNVISSQNINSDLNVISSTTNGVTTYYERIVHAPTNSLFTRERIPGISYVETCYTDTAISVYNINESDNSTISYVTYNIDPIWGTVTSIVNSDGEKITDTYDDGKCALISRKFNDNPSITNLFTYESGNLSTIANGSLKYKISYTDGRVSSISKHDATTEDTYNSIESHSYVNNSGYVTLTDSYPSATNPLHTVTRNYDVYGKLTSISGVLTNTYDIDPHCTYDEGKRYYGLESEEYDIDGNEELEFKIYGSAPINNASAKLSSSLDSLTGKTTHYGYSLDRLVGVKVTNSSSSTVSKEIFAYDDIGRLTTDRFDYDIANGKFVKSVITYDDEERIPVTSNKVKVYKYYVDSLAIQKAKTINYFDSYNRIIHKNHALVSYGFDKYYSYDKANIDSVESKYINTTRLMRNEYDYDVFGRIVGESYLDSATKNKSYVYDSFGRLVRENNQLLDKTFIYSYNGIGNITSAKAYSYTTETVSGTPVTTSYAYDSAQPDRLTTFGGKAITYDTNGQVKTYDGWTYTWTKGKLTKCVRGSILLGMDTYTYTYDAYGRRVSKNYRFTKGSQALAVYVTSSSTNYTYDTSGRLIRENYIENFNDFSSNSREIVYLYDESSVIGFVYTLNGTPSYYYYHRNLQGDVISIYDVFGVKVGGYVYDAWGNCTVTLNTDSIAEVNPIRYRGYYYDRETGLYYLNARYYNPEWRRFISTDNVANINPKTPNGINLFVYSNNDPINIQYSSAVLNSRHIGGKMSSINSAISDALSIEKNSNIKNSLPNIPGWVDTISTGLDHGFSMINPIRSSIACLQFTDLWDLMRLDGVTELPGTLSKVATVVGWGLSIAGGVISSYEKYASGASISSSIAGGLINTGISIGGMYVSTAVATYIMGALAASSLSIPGAVIVVGGAVIAVGVGIAINHLATKLTINGNTIEGHLNVFADWLIFWD